MTIVTLDKIHDKKHISLETLRRNGTPVRTPVWFVIYGDLVYVVTRKNTGKAKRIKNNPHVRIAPCSFRGKIKGDWIVGNAKFVKDDEFQNAIKLRSKKYGLLAKLAVFLSSNKGELVAFSIKPIS